MLGGRIDNAICAKLQRLLLHRRCEHIIDREFRAYLMRNLGNRRDIDDFQRGIGRAFEEKYFRIRTRCLFPSRKILAIHKGGFNTKARQPFFDHIAA